MQVDFELQIKRLKLWVAFLSGRAVVRLVGFDGARAWGRFFGACQYLMQVSNRRRCTAHLTVLLGRGRAHARATLRSAYRVNTISALEVISMVDRKLDIGRLHSRCRVEGIENLAAARSGRGAILLATHAGNSLLMLAQLSAQGWPITIVHRRSPNMPARVSEDGLRHYGFEGIAANDGFRAFAGMVDAVRRDRVVFAMMDDRVKRSEQGVVARFLGKDMRMPGGIVQLARHTRAPIVPVLSVAADPVWHFRIEPQLTITPGGTLDDDVAAVLAHVQGQILAHPGLWSWPHRRWRRIPLAATCPA